MIKIRKQIRDILQEESESKMDAILDKISTYGIDSLTDHEVDFMNQASQHDQPDQFDVPEKTYPNEEKVKNFMSQQILDIEIENYVLPILVDQDVVDVECMCYLRDGEVVFLHVEDVGEVELNRLAILESFFEEIKENTGLDTDQAADGFSEWFENSSGREIYEMRFIIKKVDLNDLS